MLEKNKTDWRILTIYILITAIMFYSVVRVYKITTTNYKSVWQNSNTYKIKLGTARKTVFDCNLLPLTNKNKRMVAIIAPTDRAISAISTVLEGEELERVLKTLKEGQPAVCEVNRTIECEGIICTNIYDYANSDLVCPQLIGYLNSEGHGVSGVQQAYDEELFSEKEICAHFAIDANGNFLEGIAPEVTSYEGITSSGIALTIDDRIQQITKNAMQNATCGAAVVVEIGSGKIRAMVSNPTYDVTKVSNYLNSPNSPFLNRALASYNVGSVFKPCVAAAVLENKKYSEYTCECSGTFKIGNHSFKCHNFAGHGKMNMATALQESCNIYFYKISQLIGGKKIWEMASSLGFGNSIDLGKIKTTQGSLTALSVLENSQTAVANLSIGQGELLLSPVSIICLYEAIANGGVYNSPTIIEGSVENGRLIKQSNSLPTKVMSEDTANTLKDYLYGVVYKGIGQAAKPDLCTAAGKTATAETGWVQEGEIIQNSWFCGFFPFENPKYAVCVMIENSKQDGLTGAPVFKYIADNITRVIK